MFKYIVGIDPGKTGGLCLLDKNGGIIEKGSMDQKTKEFDPGELFAKFTYMEDIIGEDPCMVILEKPSAFPGQGVTSMFKLGMAYGYAHMAIVAMGWSYELVHPRTWTRIMHRGADSKLKGKEKSSIVITRLFPKEDFKRTPKCSVPHDGIIDAALLAYYGYLKYNKGQLL